MNIANNLAEIRFLFDKMLLIIVKNSRSDLRFQADIMKRAIYLIDNMHSTGQTPDELLDEIKSMRKSLYPPRGGLTEFNIWNADPQIRLSANNVIDQINDRLWELMQ